MIREEILDMEIFDFVFSFAGEDREVVEAIYEKLKRKGFNIFYDSAFQAQLVGKDLYTGLRDLYKNEGKFVVCFISSHYTKKVWTNLEFSAIKERLMATFFAGDFLIPILLGNTQMMEDIPSYIGFYQHESVDNTVKMLAVKISASTVEDSYLSNINNCISHLCNRVHIILTQKNVDVFLTSANEISISGFMASFSLVFSSDPDAQVPCILVRKLTQFDKNNPFDSFPILIITWKNQNRLRFTIHEFDSSTDNLLKDMPFNDVVQYICSKIQGCLED